MRSILNSRGTLAMLSLASVALLLATCNRSRGGGHSTPVITQVVPGTGSTLGGDTVDVFTGNFRDDFTSTPLVLFGGDPATVVAVSPAKTITVLTPPHAIAEAVEVRVEGTGLTPPETARLADGFGYELGPSITSLSPDRGDVGGGTLVTISTADFQDDFTVDTPIVRFGGDPGSVVMAADARTIAVDTPSHAVAESVDVEVEATGTVQVAVAPGAFTYTDCPQIRLSCDVSGAVPNSGPVAGGNQITVTGGFFCDLNPRVIFGIGGPMVPATYVSFQELTVIVPPASAPGPVELFYGDDIGCFAVPIPFCCYTYN